MEVGHLESLREKIQHPFPPHNFPIYNGSFSKATFLHKNTAARRCHMNLHMMHSLPLRYSPLSSAKFLSLCPAVINILQFSSLGNRICIEKSSASTDVGL